MFRFFLLYAASQTSALHMKRLNQTESPIFVILCVLCFQRQSFFTFILLYCSWCCGLLRPQKVCTYIIIVQVIFYFLWDYCVHPGYFKNRIPLKPALGGVCNLANYSVAYEETQSNRVSDFRDFVCSSLFPKAILFDCYYCSEFMLLVNYLFHFPVLLQQTWV